MTFGCYNVSVIFLFVFLAPAHCLLSEQSCLILHSLLVGRVSQGSVQTPEVCDLLRHDPMWLSGQQRGGGRASEVRVWLQLQDHRGKRRRNRTEYLERQCTPWIPLLWFMKTPSASVTLVSYIPPLPHSEFILAYSFFCASQQYPVMSLQGFLTNRGTLVVGHNDPLWWSIVWVAMHQNSRICLKHKPYWQQTTISWCGRWVTVSCGSLADLSIGRWVGGAGDSPSGCRGILQTASL